MSWINLKTRPTTMQSPGDLPVHDTKAGCAVSTPTVNHSHITFSTADNDQSGGLKSKDPESLPLTSVF